jgi:hypothetical protein
MNKKRKILTVVALVVFGAIIFFHCTGIIGYIPARSERALIQPKIPGPQEWGTVKRGASWVVSAPLFSDVRMPLFVLAVFYAGLFALLGDKKRDSQ